MSHQHFVTRRGVGIATAEADRVVDIHGLICKQTTLVDRTLLAQCYHRYSCYSWQTLSPVRKERRKVASEGIAAWLKPALQCSSADVALGHPLHLQFHCRCCSQLPAERAANMQTHARARIPRMHYYHTVLVCKWEKLTEVVTARRSW